MRMRKCKNAGKEGYKRNDEMMGAVGADESAEEGKARLRCDTKRQETRDMRVVLVSSPLRWFRVWCDPSHL